MAEHKHTPSPLADPVPSSPANAAVLSGDRQTFVWEPVTGALEYRFQIAAASDFARPLLDETIPGQESSATVSGRYSTDGKAYYWRVLARTEKGWSPGERVESFVSGTPEQAALQIARPDDDEHLGPFIALVRSGSKGIKTELTRSPEAYADEVSEGVEHEGVETGQIMAIAASVLIVILGLFGGVYLIYENVWHETQQEVAGMSGYPELTSDKEEAAKKLNEYGVVDEESGVYQIPIDSAMDQIVREAPAAGAQGPAEEQ